MKGCENGQFDNFETTNWRYISYYKPKTLSKQNIAILWAISNCFYVLGASFEKMKNKVQNFLFC